MIFIGDKVAAVVSPLRGDRKLARHFEDIDVVSILCPHFIQDAGIGDNGIGTRLVVICRIIPHGR